MPEFDAEMALAFLAERFPSPEPGERIEIRALDRQAGGAVVGRGFFATPEEAVTYVATLPMTLEVYYGINPRLGQDGTKAGVNRLLAGWADMDWKHYETPQEAAAALNAFDLEPTWVIHSGGGLQPYWAIAPLDAAAHGPRLETALRALYARLGNLDAVQNIDRIFRLPGTWNNKYGEPRKVVVVARTLTATYTLDQLEAALPALPPTTGPVERQPTQPGEMSIDEVRNLLSHIPPTLPYREYLAVWMAVHSLFPGEEGRDLVDAWSSEARERNGQYSSPRTQPRKHVEFRRSGSGGAIGAGTLLFYAMQYGYQPPRRPQPMMKRRQRQAGWRGELDQLGDLDPATFPEFLRRTLDYLGPAAAPLPLDWSVQTALCFWSLGIAHIKFENLSPCLWFLGAARSNAGKNIITDALDNLWQRVRLGEPFAIVTTATPEGLYRKLDGDGKRVLSYHREFAGYLASFKRDYMGGMRDTLCNLYDGATVSHVLSRREILATNPRLVVVATTTPAGIAEHMQLGDIQSGYVNRFLCCAADAINLDVDERPTPAVAEALGVAITRHLAGFAKVRRATWDTPRGETPAAYRDICRYLGIGTGEISRFEDGVDEVGRAPMRDLARIKKAGEILETMEAAPRIAGDTLLVRESNLRLAAHIILRGAAFMRGFESIVAVSPDEQLMNRIERFLAKETLSRGVLRNRCRVGIKQFDLALDTMVSEGRVERLDPLAGTRSEQYKLAG